MLDFDKWLNRTALLSQVLLVAIALITVKLTVIPLYQKELSSEELAKAQIQLGTVNSKIAELDLNIQSKEKELAVTASRLVDTERAEITSRENLVSLNLEMANQAKNLEKIKQQNTKNLNESIRLKSVLESENQLKFRQALEWFSMVSGLGRNCYRPDLAEFVLKNKSQGGKYKAEVEIDNDMQGSCSPYSSIKTGIKTLQARKSDSSGDPLNLPDGKLEKWLGLAEVEIERRKFDMQSVYEISVFKSLNPNNLVEKHGESPADFRARFVAMENARSQYASKVRDRDSEIRNRFVRSIKLSDQ
jgi:hypothetical protein